MKLTITKVTNNYPYDLLLLADETIEGINKYLFDSEVYVAAFPGTKKPIGVFCLRRIDADTVEIMNIAVAENRQGSGVGSSLIDKAIAIAEEKGYKQIILGTADCGIKQIRFYEKNGFVQYGIKKNYFTDIYDTPIYENGVQLKDMVMLKKELIPQIQKATPDDYSNIMAVWESSVKATHDFLKTEDINFFKETIPGYFPHVDLFVLCSDNKIRAFMGISGGNLEMLFVSEECRGKGYGKQLLKFGIDNLGITKVDVNEQNKQALGFYEKFGFKTIARSEKDSTGKDYPILHLSRGNRKLDK